ncbi:MAG: cyclic-di-AMP receptor [Anaerolineae bacterium]
MTKMIMAVIPREQVECVLSALIDAGHTATYSESRGGMLRQSQQMLFIAVKAEHLQKVLAIIRENCRSETHAESSDIEPGGLSRTLPVTADLGGAVVFVWELDRFETY